MELTKRLLREFEHEASNTRKILERVPVDHFDWSPHAKSMSLKELAGHIAELPGMFIAAAITTEELDFSKQKYNPFSGTTHKELMDSFEDNYLQAVQALSHTSEEELAEHWTLRNGAHVVFTMPRLTVIRNVAMNHFIHHRGQLSVYLRLLDVPVPGMYGPSADEGFRG